MCRNLTVVFTRTSGFTFQFLFSETTLESNQDFYNKRCVMMDLTAKSIRAVMLFKGVLACT